jgi:Ion channel
VNHRRMPEPRAIAQAPGMSRHPGERWTRFAGRIAHAFGLVLLLVLVTYVLASLTPYRGWTAVATAAVASASATVALATAEARPAMVRCAGWLSVLAVVLAAIAAASGGSPPLGVSALIQMLLLSAAAVSVLRAVVTEAEVGFRTILGAISVYVVLGLLFTFLYVAIDRLQGGPFFAAGARAGTGGYIFFSLTTLTTTGYGNLVPAGQPGRMFAGLEMLIGQIFLVTLIAGLVSLWRPGELAAKRLGAKRDQ